LDNGIIVSIVLWIIGLLMIGFGFSIVESWGLGGGLAVVIGLITVVAGLYNIIKND